MARHVMLTIVFLGCCSGPGLAQASDGDRARDEAPRTRLQVGLGFKSTMTPGPDSTSAVTPDLVWRWRGKDSRTDARWAPTYGLGSLRTRVSSLIGASSLPVGDLRMRPLVVGMDYKVPHGRWEWSVGASIGWSLNRIATPRTYHHRAALAEGAGDLWVDVDNSLVWGPRIKGAYDVNDRVSFIVESAYMMTRPTLEMRASGRVTTTRLNADALVMKMGIVYGIF